jgi:hypothetical protein
MMGAGFAQKRAPRLDDRRLFKSAGQAQRFLSAHDRINNLFRLRRDRVAAAEHRASRNPNVPGLGRNAQHGLAINLIPNPDRLHPAKTDLTS